MIFDYNVIGCKIAGYSRLYGVTYCWLELIFSKPLVVFFFTVMSDIHPHVMYVCSQSRPTGYLLLAITSRAATIANNDRCCYDDLNIICRNQNSFWFSAQAHFEI